MHTPSVKDTWCDSCGFRISEGVYAYMAGSRMYCQKCVRGPAPYGHEPTREQTCVQKAEALQALPSAIDFTPSQRVNTLF